MRALLPMMLLLCACAPSFSYVPTNAPPRKLYRLDPEQVTVYYGRLPASEYVEVGILQVSQDTTYGAASPNGQIQRLRKEAGARGCDGLLIVQSVSSVTLGLGTHVQQGLRASCLVSTSSAGMH